jgi:hypothetical protein
VFLWSKIKLVTVSGLLGLTANMAAPPLASSNRHGEHGGQGHDGFRTLDLVITHPGSRNIIDIVSL